MRNMLKYTVEFINMKLTEILT